MQPRFSFRVFVGVAVLTLAAGVNSAVAQVYWSSIATACAPDSNAIRFDQYANPADSTVALSPTNTDLLVLVCNVPYRNGATPNQLSMSYLDSTGQSTAARVRAFFMSVDRATGNSRAAISGVASDALPSTTNALRRSPLFTHVIDHALNYYYVRIEIDRTLATEDVRAIGVALEFRTPAPAEPPELAGITAAHNQVRAEVAPSAVPPLAPLTWDQSLADTAAAWASQCVDQAAPIGLIDHNPNRSVGHPYYVGENIYASSGSATAQGAVSSWASEAANYNYAANTCSGVCGHYTQIVWRSTLKVGCALRTCPALQFGSTIVCNYGPGGNINGARPY